MTKQEAIREHWVAIVGEENFDKLTLDENGFSQWGCRRHFSRSKDDLIYSRIQYARHKLESDKIIYRPKSLDGLEKNNMWMNVFSEDDLPKIAGNFHVEHDNGTFIHGFDPETKEWLWDCEGGVVRTSWQTMKVKAWRLIPEPPKRLYDEKATR